MRVDLVYLHFFATAILLQNITEPSRYEIGTYYIGTREVTLIIIIYNIITE